MHKQCVHVPSPLKDLGTRLVCMCACVRDKIPALPGIYMYVHKLWYDQITHGIDFHLLLAVSNPLLIMSIPNTSY